MSLGRTARFRSELGPFFLYLRVVRGLSVRYALELVYALRRHEVRTRTAYRYLNELGSGWWEFAEEDEGFNLWRELGIRECMEAIA